MLIVLLHLLALLIAALVAFKLIDEITYRWSTVDVIFQVILTGAFYALVWLLLLGIAAGFGKFEFTRTPQRVIIVNEQEC